MNVSSRTIYEPGEKVICVLASNSYLEFGKTYTIKSISLNGSKLYPTDINYITLEEEPLSSYNVARFVSISDFRNFQINTVIDE